MGVRKFFSSVRNFFLVHQSVKQISQEVPKIAYSIKQLHELTFQNNYEQKKVSAKNPFNRYGKKYFSQTDEDGLTMEIIKRLELEPQNGLFAEFGVGDGSECNTLITASMGFSGFWCGNENLIFDHTNLKRFKYIKQWITLDNIGEIIEKGIGYFDSKTKDDLKIISLDLDGNDFYFVEKILNNYKPDLFIVEYNALFPPPVRFCIDYDPNHNWELDDYFGCSLQTYNELFIRNGYFLVCCNLNTGGNAFFIKNEFSHRFPEIPDSINDIFIDANYLLSPNTNFHKKSPKTIRKLFDPN